MHQDTRHVRNAAPAAWCHSTNGFTLPSMRTSAAFVSPLLVPNTLRRMPAAVHRDLRPRRTWTTRRRCLSIAVMSKYAVLLLQAIVRRALDVRQRQVREHVEHLRHHRCEPALVQITQKTRERQFARERVVEELVDVGAEVPPARERTAPPGSASSCSRTCSYGASVWSTVTPVVRAQPLDGVIGGAVVEKHTVPDAERLVMIHERPDVQRTIAHDRDDEELVRSVLDVRTGHAGV